MMPLKRLSSLMSYFQPVELLGYIQYVISEECTYSPQLPQIDSQLGRELIFQKKWQLVFRIKNHFAKPVVYSKQENNTKIIVTPN